MEIDFYKDESGWTHLDRLTDGRAACCICFCFFGTEGLEPVSDEPGRYWDVCLTCAAEEKDHGASHY